MTNRSKELYEQWKDLGGNLRQYDEHIRPVTTDTGFIKWHESRVRRVFSAKDGVIENMAEIDPDEQSHLYFKHRSTDTWMHVKSSTSLVIDEDMGFKAWVTVDGQSLTVGEYHVSTDPHEVFQWAREWMENHPDGYDD